MFWWIVLGIGALIAGTAIVITVTVLCIEEIIKAIIEYIKQRIIDIITGTGRKPNPKMERFKILIKEKYKNGDFYEVKVGLINSANENIDEITLRSTDIKHDFYEGQIIESEVY